MVDSRITRLRELLRRARAGDMPARQELEEGLGELCGGEYGEFLSRWRAVRSGESLSIQELCPGNPERAQVLHDLVRFMEEVRTFLNELATVPAAQSSLASDGKLPSLPGYELLGVLGTGGMGVV